MFDQAGNEIKALLTCYKQQLGFTVHHRIWYSQNLMDMRAIPPLSNLPITSPQRLLSLLLKTENHKLCRNHDITLHYNSIPRQLNPHFSTDQQHCCILYTYIYCILYSRHVWYWKITEITHADLLHVFLRIQNFLEPFYCGFFTNGFIITVSEAWQR